MPRTKPPTNTTPASTRTTDCARCAAEIRNTHRGHHEHGTECPALELTGEHRFVVRFRDDVAEADTAADALAAIKQLRADFGREPNTIPAAVMDNVRGRYVNGPELDAEARATESIARLEARS